MQTKVMPCDGAGIRAAADLLRRGELVGFPTETVYGLGAAALQPQAVAKIFAAKGRPADNPLIVHIAGREMAEPVARFTPLAEKLAARFWPGPLTLVLPRRAVVPDIVTAGLDTVGLRWPSHPAAAAMIAAAGLPVAAPSANRSGRPSPTLARHVLEDLAGRVPLILDAGPVEIGLESTVVDATGALPVLLRPGKITMEELASFCGGCLLPDGKSSERPPAPGMKYRHYAPQGALYLAADYRAAEALRQRLLAADPAPPLMLLSDASANYFRGQGLPEDEILSLGANEAEFAARLFAALREADTRRAGRIICETTKESGLGRAIMNRLARAAAAATEPGGGVLPSPAAEGKA